LFVPLSVPSKNSILPAVAVPGLNIGSVKVLFVKVCVPVRVTSPVPAGKVYMSGLVPSFAVANTIASLLLVAVKVNVSPEPEAYLNWC